MKNPAQCSHSGTAVTFRVWSATSHLSLYLMKTWYSIVAPGAARASFSSLRKWVCTESSSCPKGKRKEEMGLNPGHRHRVTGEKRVAHMPQGRLQPETISWERGKEVWGPAGSPPC